MAFKLVVTHTFTLTRTGEAESAGGVEVAAVVSQVTYNKGDQITDPDTVAAILETEHEHHVVKVAA